MQHGTSYVDQKGGSDGVQCQSTVEVSALCKLLYLYSPPPPIPIEAPASTHFLYSSSLCVLMLPCMNCNAVLRVSSPYTATFCSSMQSLLQVPVLTNVRSITVHALDHVHHSFLQKWRCGVLHSHKCSCRVPLDLNTVFSPIHLPTHCMCSDVRCKYEMQSNLGFSQIIVSSCGGWVCFCRSPLDIWLDG